MVDGGEWRTQKVKKKKICLMSQKFRGHQLSWVPFGDSNPSCCLGTQSCPTLRDPMDCSPPGFPVHGTLQSRTLEWGAISFSRGSSRPRDQTRVSFIGRQILYHGATWGAPQCLLLTVMNDLSFLETLPSDFVPQIFP